MPARTPNEFHDVFAATFNAGDLDAVVALFEPDAVLAPQPGQIVKGHVAIREALKGFFALKPRIALQLRKAFESGDIALLCSTWTLTGTAPTGDPVQLAGQTTDVIRRQPDGTWLLIIDNPYGLE
jgi:uncharacterized protein (TIGR02246 family)